MAQASARNALSQPVEGSEGKDDDQDEPSAEAALLLWRAYNALPPHEKLVMQLLALIDPPVDEPALIGIARSAETSGPEGKPWQLRMLDEVIEF